MRKDKKKSQEKSHDRRNGPRQGEGVNTFGFFLAFAVFILYCNVWFSFSVIKNNYPFNVLLHSFNKIVRYFAFIILMFTELAS